MDRTLTFRFFGKDYTASSTMKDLAKEAELSHLKITELAASVVKWTQRAGIALTALGSTTGYAIAHVGMAYEDAMQHFSASSGATEEQLKAVNEQAMKLGNGLLVPGASAQTAMEAFAGLADAGSSVKQSMASARGSMLLAAAAGLEEGQAADFTSSVLREFGLRANQATVLADDFASALNNASGSSADMGDALKFVAPVARQTGINLHDATTALVLLSREGMNGQHAGGALAQVLVKLNPTTKAAASHLKALGISAYDSTGHFRGMEAVIAQLEAAHKRLSPAQFQTYAAMAFGRYSIKTVDDLVMEGTKGWKRYTEQIGEQGAAIERAKRLHEGLGGALTNLKNQLTNIGIAVFQTVEPTITNWLNKFSAYLSKINLEQMATHLAAIGTSVAQRLVPQVLALASNIQHAALAVEPMAKQLAMLAGAGLIAGIKALTAAFGFIAEHARGLRATVIALGIAFIIWRATITAIVAKDLIGSLGASMVFLARGEQAVTAKTVEQRAAMVLMTAASKAWAAVTWAMEAAWLALNGAFSLTGIGTIITLIGLAVFGLYELYKHSDTARRVMNEAFGVIKRAAGIMVFGIVSYFKLLFDAWMTVIGGIINGAWAVAKHLPIPFKGAIGDAVGAFNDLRSGADSAMADVQNSAYSMGFATGNNYANGIVNGYGTVSFTVNNASGTSHGNQTDLPGGRYAGHPVANSTKVYGAVHTSRGGGGGSGPVIASGLAGGSGMPDLGGGGGGGSHAAKAKHAAKQAAKALTRITAEQAKELAQGIFDGWKHVAVYGKLSSGLEKMLDGIAAQIKAITTKWADKIKASREQLATDLKAKADEAKQFADSLMPNISGAFTTDPNNNRILGSVGGYLSGQLSQLKTFLTDIGILRSMGLSPDIVKMIVNAGPVDGDQMAKQLINGGKSGMASLNATQSAITATAGAIGNIVAGQDYDKKIADDQKTLAKQLAEQRKQTKLLHDIVHAILSTAMTAEQLQKALLKLKRQLGTDLGLA